VAQSQVQTAEAEVGVAQSSVASAQAQQAGAEAAVAQVQAQLELLQAGARREDVAPASAAVAQAQAAVDAANAMLAQADLRAPFAGVVGAIAARLGEVALPGQPVLTLGNTRALRVETTDLRETDVARIQVGQRVDVTFDALPGEVFAGTITRIAPMANDDKGSVNYTVIVELDELSPALRWGMTAFVNIEVGK